MNQLINSNPNVILTRQICGHRSSRGVEAFIFSCESARGAQRQGAWARTPQQPKLPRVTGTTAEAAARGVGGFTATATTAEAPAPLIVLPGRRQVRRVVPPSPPHSLSKLRAQYAPPLSNETPA